MKTGAIGSTVLLLLVAYALPFSLHAQDATGINPVEQEYLEKAVVTDASASEPEQLPGTSVTSPDQTLTVQVLDGPDKGATPTFENNYTQVKTGDMIYVRHTTGGDAPDLWAMSDPYRLPALGILAGVFLLLVLVFGGWQGIRGLASLAGSLILLFYVLLPGILHGYSPILVSTGVASLIIIAGSYITHGWNRATHSAVLGMLVTVLITGLGAYWAVHSAALSGYTSEDNVYLNFDTSGTIDMVGLLFGGIMIGLLGVLYDIAIGQAVAIDELFDAGKHLTRFEVYKKGLRIGREHIGALINTLAIAYVGASLPLLLLFHSATAGIAYTINSELFATEIVRILIGSIGLVLAVPITTLIASYLLSPKQAVSEKS